MCLTFCESASSFQEDGVIEAVPLDQTTETPQVNDKNGTHNETETPLMDDDNGTSHNETETQQVNDDSGTTQSD